MKKETAAKAETPAPKFEEGMDRLENLVRELEEGELPLEETIARFEEGQALLKTLTETLDKAELKVKQVLRQAEGADAPLAEGEWDGDEGEDAAS